MKNRRILIVEDDKSVRTTRELLLRLSGYEVSTAAHGLDALAQMKISALPDLIISDLNMPLMSGFEFLSVVRRRFPQIPVIASSGAYHDGDAVAGGIIADRFHVKVGSGPATLMKMIAELLAISQETIRELHARSAPVWIPRNGHDSTGVPFVVVTCTDCLRSFPLSVAHQNQEVQETDCLFCSTKISYIIDFSREVTSPKRPTEASVATSVTPQRRRSEQVA